jgi:Rieske Fe-S protein
MQRRDFLKGACRICLLGAAGASAIDITGCSPAVGNTVFSPEIIDNTIQIPFTAFDQKFFQVLSPKKYPYEVAVQKKEDGTYKALLMQCTHYENQLIPTGRGFSCNAHGSRFDKEGKVTKGPAETPLKQLATTKTETNLIVHLLKLK